MGDRNYGIIPVMFSFTYYLGFRPSGVKRFHFLVMIAF